MPNHLSEVRHQTICQYPAGTLFGYFGWPTAALLPDGTVAVAASGFRNSHICPFGVTVLWQSSAQGDEWSAPQVITALGIDVRDPGILALRDGTLCVSCFTSDTRFYYPGEARPYHLDFRPVLDGWEDENVRRELGSFLRFRSPDGCWSRLFPVKVSAPHGPVQLKNGDLLYLGAQFGEERPDGSLEFEMNRFNRNRILALRSSDCGRTWRTLGRVPEPEDPEFFWCEPHVVECSDGTLLGMLRREERPHFSTWQTRSTDGGESWSTPERITFGAPPHLLRLRSGVLVLSYGYRQPGFGQRVRFSADEGKSWSEEYILRDDGPNGDLGYPSTVELSDGTLLTVYYHSPGAGVPCGVHATLWRRPDAAR